MRKSLWAAGAALALVSTAAIAAVTFDFDTGYGFVGKGDVQTGFGWKNNAEFQRNESAVTFTVNLENSWECTKTITPGPNEPFDIVIEHNSDTTGVVSAEHRMGQQVDGFVLQGYSSIRTTGGPSRNTCPDEHSNFVEGSTQSTGGLYANYGSTSILLLAI